jgi:hypothetical protein
MTHREKSKELISKFYPHVRWKLSQDDCLDRAKECALVVVDEIYQILEYKSDKEYWQLVKNEIEKI